MNEAIGFLVMILMASAMLFAVWSNRRTAQGPSKPRRRRAPSNPEPMAWQRTHPDNHPRDHRFLYDAKQPNPGGKDDLLVSQGMPPIESENALAHWLELTPKTMAPLVNAQSRCRGEIGNYFEWTVPKKRGGLRLICAAKPNLKRVQEKILRHILDKAILSEAAQGFRKGRSIVTHSANHVGAALVVQVDLENFFTQVKFPRVMGVFMMFGYRRRVARLLALLCTHRPDLFPVYRTGHHPRTGDEVPIDGSVRHAVQGASTSAALSNLVCKRLDSRLTGLANRFGAAYSRYGDDLAFSGDRSFKKGMKRFFPLVRKILREEGFKVNKHKINFMRRGTRQKITGLIINDRLNVPRAEYDRLRALLYNANRLGSLESQNRRNHPLFRQAVTGHIAHINQVNSGRGAKLKAMLDSVPD